MVKIKVQASSLVEVTVAMVLLTIAIGFTFTILLSLSRSGESAVEMKWRMLAKARMAETIEEKLYTDSEIQEGEVFISRYVLPYKGMNNLLLLEIHIIGVEGDTLARQRELVYVAQ